MELFSGASSEEKTEDCSEVCSEKCVKERQVIEKELESEAKKIISMELFSGKFAGSELAEKQFLQVGSTLKLGGQNRGSEGGVLGHPERRGLNSTYD